MTVHIDKKLTIMYCKNCGKQLNEGAAVCLNCGVKVGEGTRYCQNCGAQPDPLAAICVKCGTNLKTQKGSNGGSSDAVIDSFGAAIKTCFNKYAVFEGRANRSEYWYWALFNFILGCIPYLGWLAMLGTIIPSIAVAVRRLHDLGKSGWNYLFCLIPIAGPILLLIWFCTPSQEGDNQYGANPN